MTGFDRQRSHVSHVSRDFSFFILQQVPILIPPECTKTKVRVSPVSRFRARELRRRYERDFTADTRNTSDLQREEPVWRIRFKCIDSCSDSATLWYRQRMLHDLCRLCFKTYCTDGCQQSTSHTSHPENTSYDCSHNAREQRCRSRQGTGHRKRGHSSKEAPGRHKSPIDNRLDESGSST